MQSRSVTKVFGFLKINNSTQNADPPPPPPPPPRVDRVHATPSVINMAKPAPGVAPLAEQWKEYVIPGCMTMFAVWWVFG